VVNYSLRLATAGINVEVKWSVVGNDAASGIEAWLVLQSTSAQLGSFSCCDISSFVVGF
jgi:hypothetical protein